MINLKLCDKTADVVWRDRPKGWKPERQEVRSQAPAAEPGNRSEPLRATAE